MVAHVPMTGNVSDVSNGKQKAMYVLPLYVMGDKVRQVKTSAMYTMTLVMVITRTITRVLSQAHLLLVL